MFLFGHCLFPILKCKSKRQDFGCSWVYSQVRIVPDTQQIFNKYFFNDFQVSSQRLHGVAEKVLHRVSGDWGSSPGCFSNQLCDWEQVSQKLTFSFLVHKMTWLDRMISKGHVKFQKSVWFCSFKRIRRRNQDGYRSISGRKYDHS